MKTILLKELGPSKELEKFDGDFKVSLERLQTEFALERFCQGGGRPADLNVYQIELKQFNDQKAVGVIHVSFIEHLKSLAGAGRRENHHHLRYGFELNRESGNLRLGKGFLRT